LYLLTINDIQKALKRLGELALAQGGPIELLAAGGVVMALAFNARLATHDVDAIVVNQERLADVRKYAKIVAEEMGWNHGWLNDGVKGFMVGSSLGEVIYCTPGITVVGLLV